MRGDWRKRTPLSLRVQTARSLVGGRSFVSGVLRDDVHARLWVFVGSNQVHWYHRTGMFFLEQPIEGFQKNRFEARTHLRQFGFGFQHSMEVDLMGFKLIRAVHRGRCAWNYESEITEICCCIAQFNVTGKLGDCRFIFIRFIFRLLSSGFSPLARWLKSSIVSCVEVLVNWPPAIPKSPVRRT